MTNHHDLDNAVFGQSLKPIKFILQIVNGKGEIDDVIDYVGKCMPK